MKYRLPESVSSVNPLGRGEFVADENGVIDVPADAHPDVHAGLSQAGALPYIEEDEPAAGPPVDERRVIVERLKALGERVDGRTKIEYLRERLAEAEAAAAQAT